MINMFSVPMQLVAVIIGVFLLGPYCSESFVQLFFTVSLFFKAVLSTILPLVIVAFVVTGIISFKKNAPVVLAVLLVSIVFSNALVALVVYGLARLLLSFEVDAIAHHIFTVDDTIVPLYQFTPLQWVSSQTALIGSILCGIALSYRSWAMVERSLYRLRGLIERFLISLFIPLLPLYVFGFLLKIQHEGTFIHLFTHFGRTCGVIIVIQWLYLLWLYLVSAGFSWRKATQFVQTALPSYVTAFSTMSSTTTIPVSIVAAEKNTGNRSLALMAMPIMANVHLVGDSISTPLLALGTTSLFLGTIPSFVQYSYFVVYFCMAMFAISGIPGGGILIVSPVLESHLGFTQEMISIITALYLLMDSFGTAANVMGDGALVIMVDKVLKKLNVR